ncbi:MAG: tetratricopeptide repeat protein [Pseudomonadota bacterium]
MLRRITIFLISAFALMVSSVFGEAGMEMFNSGIREFTQGNFAMAVGWFTKLAELEPDNEHAYNNRGIAYLELKEYDRALEDFQTVQVLNPDKEDIHFNIGTAYSYKKQPQEAARHYTIAISRNPENYAAYYNRGVAREDLKQYDGAIQDLTTFLRFNRDHYWALAYLGDAYADSGRLSLARDSYTKAVAADPGNAYAKRKLKNLEKPGAGKSSPRDIRMGDETRFQVNWNESGKGLTITKIGAGPMKSAGIRKGDVIIAVNGKPLTKGDPLLALKDEIVAGKVGKAMIEVRRGETVFLLEVTK